jgi:ABC-type polysaccharide/polyol phosphate transport system ATPase subunit
MLMARIQMDRVCLTFRVRAQQQRINFHQLIVGRLFRRAFNPIVEVKALHDFSLEVASGERLGIIGHNGAGKSTLLKVLAGIYPPTSGRLKVDGQISSLFDIALGFETEATGWENICYRGYLQGETPRTIRGKMQQIADFSELGKFLDMPVRYYSAGMRLRLAFSIATAIEPEVLLVDEVLSVGDRAFTEKATKRMREMMTKAQLIVMVSHDLDSIRRLCQRVIWMDHGSIRQMGRPQEVIDAYKAWAKQAAQTQAA